MLLEVALSIPLLLEPPHIKYPVCIYALVYEPGTPICVIIDPVEQMNIKEADKDYLKRLEANRPKGALE